jgi:hypothetical protein
MGNKNSKKKSTSVEEQYPNFVPRKHLRGQPSSSSPDIITTPPAEEKLPEVTPVREENQTVDTTRPAEEQAQEVTLAKEVNQTVENDRIEERLKLSALPIPEASPSPNSPRQRHATGEVNYDKFCMDIQEENYNLLKEEFNNPKVFLTNQILMSVQFFQNFER